MSNDNEDLYAGPNSTSLSPPNPQVTINEPAQTAGHRNDEDMVENDTARDTETDHDPPVTANLVQPRSKSEWLNSVYVSLDDGTQLQMQDFLNTKSSRDEQTSWWQDSHISWTLEFLRRRYAKHTDVLFVSLNDAAMLYRIVTIENYLDEQDTKEYKMNWAPLRARLGNHNFVIIPVNNGFGQTYVQDSVGQGAHWSFIVVDRQDKEHPTARYVDGTVSARQSRVKRKNKNEGGRRTVWKIRGIEHNGTTAGQVLRGFERLLDLPKGGFDARTLKFIPHMVRADRYKREDAGRCGPHMYAFMEHILANKENLIDPGMDAAYNNDDANIRKQRERDLSFHSRQIREKLVTELVEERRRQEQANDQLHPDNMTPEVWADMFTFDRLVEISRWKHSDQNTVPEAGAKPRNNNRKDDDSDSDIDDEHGNSKSIDKENEKDSPEQILINDEMIRQEIDRDRNFYSRMPSRARRSAAMQNILEYQKALLDQGQDESLNGGNKMKGLGKKDGRLPPGTDQDNSDKDKIGSGNNESVTMSDSLLHNHVATPKPRSNRKRKRTRDSDDTTSGPNKKPKRKPQKSKS